MKNLAIACITVAFMASPLLATFYAQKPVFTVVPLDLDRKSKKEIHIADLPENISAALKNTEHHGWDATHAWKIKTDRGWVYHLELMRGNDTKKLQFSEAGSALLSLSDCL